MKGYESKPWMYESKPWMNKFLGLFIGFMFRDFWRIQISKALCFGAGGDGDGVDGQKLGFSYLFLR
ncbi:hypothetical protein CCACVL1_18198 [Corchorus capsularis]|uniref:Uncharacterized protein n=1 Tax=Corchorus capsularis TaxID=210143 RepID=A0A1R3HMI2_COCAP|nr:hypothetical protein CCACVL1_18198 [Corchorus capsularis]